MMSIENDLFERVCTYVREFSRYGAAPLYPTTELDVVGLDSLSTFQFVLGLEDYFGLSIPEDLNVGERVRTIGDVALLVQELLASTPSRSGSQ